MARCNNDVLLKKISNNKLDQNTELDFRIRKDLPDCKKINTKSPHAVSGTYTLNKNKKPINRFECMRTGCVNTGLIMMDVADEIAVYRAMYDATEFSQGVVTFYVYPDEALTSADYPINLTFMVSDTDTFTDADSWNVTITEAMVTSDGFVPVMVNIAEGATDIGNGWTPSATGAYFRLTADKKVGYSSISIFDSIDDFDLLETVTMSCLTTIGGTFDLEVVVAQCEEARYNDNVTTLNYPVTGTKITPNFMNLFPMMEKGNATVGFDMVTADKTVDVNAHVVLPDMNQDVCGYTTVQIKEGCDVAESTLIQSSANNIAYLDEKHYIVEKNDDGTTTLLFHESMKDVEVLIRYPRKAEVEEFVANVKNLNSKQLSMTVPFYSNDGTKTLLIFDNVFITSFPMTITTEESSFAFTLAIGRDADGNFMRVQKIVA